MLEAGEMGGGGKKWSRLVEHGTNSRSSGAAREAVAKMREGVIGDVYMARGLCFKWRNTIGRKPEEAVPQGVHYDLWLGPAPEHRFTQNRFHYNWHWFWDYGNGDIGNQGIHQVDVCRWGLGVKYPTKVSPMGGHFMFDADQETPNTITATFEFDGGGKKKLMVFDVRHWITNKEAGLGVGDETNCVGATFYGSDGYLANESEDFGWDHSLIGKAQRPGATGSDPGENRANFSVAVRAGKTSHVNSLIEGEASSAN